MVDSHAHDSTYEPEILQMMLIAESGVGVDLKGVVVTGSRRGERVSHIGLVKVITPTYPAEYSKRP